MCRMANKGLIPSRILRPQQEAMTTMLGGEAVYGLHSLYMYRKLMRSKNNPFRNVAYFLEIGRFFRCTDPKDKIYSLLGLIKDLTAIQIKPNYAISVSEAYIDATKQVLLTASNLDILNCVVYPKHLSLPTWTPDWSYYRTDLHPFSIHSSFPFHASKDSIPTPEIDICNNALTLQGAIIDTVACITEPLHPKDHMLFLHPQESYPIFAQSLIKVCKHLGHQCHAGNIPPSLLEPLARTLAANSFSGGKELPADIVGTFQSFLDLFRGVYYRARGDDEPLRTAMEQGSNVDDASIYCGAIVPRVVNRSLCVTGNGYLSLVPLDTKVNDRVSILYGEKTPYILRQQGPDFTLVGETYVHGLMNGEALEDPEFQGRVRKIRIL
jgi:hypothetical protein